MSIQLVFDVYNDVNADDVIIDNAACVPTVGSIVEFSGGGGCVVVAMRYSYAANGDCRVYVRARSPYHPA